MTSVSAEPADGAMPASSAPRDLRIAIAHLQANLHRSVPTAELVAVAGVTERTLYDHFRRFIGVAPGIFSVQIRLAAVRRLLQQSSNRDPIGGIALRYGFSHQGRFSGQYRQAFRELPTATRRAAVVSVSTAVGEVAAPAPRGDRPEIVVMPILAPATFAGLAELLSDSIAASLSGPAIVAVSPPWAPPERYREPRARYVIRGRIEPAGEHFRVVVALVDAVDQVHLWGDAWDGWATNPFSAIDRVVAGVERAILPNIRKAEIARVMQRRPEDLEAHELCLRAYPLLTASTPAAARQALELLYRAIERDPDFGLAAGLAAWAHSQLVLQIGSASPADDIAQARLLSSRAGILDPDDPMVLTARCMVHTMADQHDVAGALVERALARDPRSPWAWERRGWLKLYSGDMRAGIACFGRSLRLDASSTARVTRFVGIGAGLSEGGRDDLTVRWMQRALDAEPGAAWVNRALAVSYARIGEHQMANRSLDALRRYRPDITVADVVSALRFRPDFVSRIANGLNDLGLPP